MNYNNIINDLNKLADMKKSKILGNFFKTWKWEYAEWDKFLWINVPNQRDIADKYIWLWFSDLSKLLDTDIHEYRFTALAILVNKYKKSDEKIKKSIVDFYIDNIRFVNNWDLVDCSCYHILWNYFLDKDRSILYKFVKSDNLWERRISVISTFEFIRKLDFKDTLKICEILLYDRHDLIHKACWWMLREIWKRDQNTEQKFLDKYYKIMPRTMLRYSIEKFDIKLKDFYMWR
jgi:3-methyladenine DNA glycosylase AlkD